MTQGLLRTGEVVVAVALMALAGFAALALSHGGIRAPILVEIAMAAGFLSMVRMREADAKGRRVQPWEPWRAALWFGLAAIGLLAAPSL
jgi:hypothetical protein